MPREPLRAALLLDSTTVPAWALEAIRRSAAEGHTRWLLVICNSPAGARQNFRQRLRAKWHTALASSYVRLDQLVSPADRDPLAPFDVRRLLPDIPQLSAGDHNITSIASYDLDLIVNFSRQPPSENLLVAAKLGVWTFHFGEQGDNSRPEFNGLCEVVENRDVNHAALQMLTGDNRRVTLAETYSAVDRLSASRNRSNLYWPAVSLLPRQLVRLHELGPENFRAEVATKNNTDKLHDATFPRSLSNHKFLPGLLRLAARRLKRKWTKHFYRDQWFLLSHFNDSSSARSPGGKGKSEADTVVSTYHAESAGTKVRLENFQPIVPPIDRFWADPHAIQRDGKLYVFFEEYLYDTGKAHISVMEFDDRGQWQPPRPVLVRPYHLSYPFLFHWQGQLYMIPETAANRTLEIYHCDAFPDRWSLHKTLWQNVSAYDATLVEHAGHWWMFTTLAENAGGSSWDELFLFHADQPLSDHWLPHPCNPIVSDVRRARPAGPLFLQDGYLHRPAQDCSRTYGYGIRLQRIEELSPTRYVESEIRRIEPLANRGWEAVHTLSAAGGLTMIDAQRRRLRFCRDSSRPPGIAGNLLRSETERLAIGNAQTASGI